MSKWLEKRNGEVIADIWKRRFYFSLELAAIDNLGPLFRRYRLAQLRRKIEEQHKADMLTVSLMKSLVKYSEAKNLWNEQLAGIDLDF